MRFSEFELHPDLLESITATGFETATPVQEQAIPKIISGKDIIASAQTGTGKTAAFLLPIVHKILTEPHDDDRVKALIIVPTRELAIQIDQQLEGLSYYTSISSIAIYGGNDGSSFAREKKALTHGADIIVCTPGRMMAHLKMKDINLKSIKYLVLDEADRMLDMGFHDDIMNIITYLPDKRQNLMFSATMPPKIRTLANKILNAPDEISIAISRPPDKIVQVAFVVHDAQKIPLIKYLFAAKKLQSVIIFCSTKSSVKQLSRELKKEGYLIEDIHSDLDQKAREEVLINFRNKKINVLVATDILSRGIDIDDIELVINYNVPDDGEDYIHRIGRTARIESKGVAFTLIGENEHNKFQDIETLLGKPVPKAKVPESLGPAPAYQPRTRNRGGSGPKKSFRGKKRFNKGKK